MFRFKKLSDFRKIVFNIMKRMGTNLAIAVIREVNENDKGQIIEDTKYKVFVTKDKRTEELNFFIESGVHMTWLTLVNDLNFPKYIDLISLTDIADTKILAY